MFNQNIEIGFSPLLASISAIIAKWEAPERNGLY